MVGTDSKDNSSTTVTYPEGSTRIEAVSWDGKRTLVYGKTVSYTHLDVYKRQLQLRFPRGGNGGKAVQDQAGAAQMCIRDSPCSAARRYHFTASRLSSMIPSPK